MITKRTLIAAGGALLLTGLLFYLLSGGQETAIKRQQTEAIEIHGYYYEGEARSMAKVFEKAEAVLPPQAVLCAWYYTDPAADKDSVSAFVGYTGASAVAGQSLETRQFGPADVLTATVVIGSLLSAPRVYESLADYAKEQNIKLSETSLELYPDDKTTIVHVPVSAI